MKMKWVGWLLSLAAFNVMAGIVARDDEGKVFTFPHSAERIISLSPHITELLFAAGGEGRIVGVTKYSDFPEAAKSIPTIGDSRELDMEKIITLKPDMIIVWRQGTSAKQVAQLRKIGIPVFVNDQRMLDDIPKSIEIFGQLMGTQTQANQSADKLRQQLAAITQKYANLPRIRLFFQVWDKPLYTLNGDQIVSDAIRVCGGENIFSRQKMTAPSVSLESVLKENPEVIVGTAERNSSSESLAMWKRYPMIAAVKKGNLLLIDRDLIGRAGPRMIAGTKALCEALENARRPH